MKKTLVFTMPILAAAVLNAAPLPETTPFSGNHTRSNGVWSVTDTSKAGGNYIVSKKFAARPQDQVIFFGEAKSEKVTTRTEAMIFALDKNGNRLTSFGSNSITGTRDWTQLKLILAPGKLPAGTTDIQLVLQPAAGPAEGTGKADFRNLDLYIGKPQIPDLAKYENWIGAKHEKIDGAIRIQDTSTQGGVYIISPTYPVTANQQINLTAEGKCDQVTTRSEIIIMAVDKAQKRLKSFSTNSIAGQQDWTPLKVTIPAGALPENTAGYYIILQPAAGPAEGVGEASFRNIKVDVSTPPAVDPMQKQAWAGMRYEIVDGAMKLVDPSTTGASYVTSKSIKVDAKKPWQLTADVKCENVTSRTQIYVFVFDRNNKRVDILSSNTISGNSDWERLSLEVDKFHVDADHVQIAMQPAAGPAEGTGTAYFKNLKFAHTEPLPTMPGREHIQQTIIKLNKVKLYDRKLKSTPFAAPLPQCRVEIMQAEPQKNDYLQLVTGDDITKINLAVWEEDQDKYTPCQPVEFKKISRGYLIDVKNLKAWRKLALEFPGRELVQLDSIRLYQPEYPQENWQAFWIWFTRERIENIQCYLRGEFELTELPTSAMMQGAVDDGGVVYLNGKRVVGIFGRSAPPNEDVIKHLKIGKNVISAQVNQARYAAGLIVEMDMLFPDGKNRKIITDRTWRCTTQKPEKNWQQVDFDDSAWDRCIEIARPPEIWGHVPYRMNSPKTAVTVVKHNLPTELEAGNSYLCNIDLELKNNNKPDTPIKMQLRRNGVSFTEYDLGVFPADAENYSASFEIKLSDFIQPGEYELFFIMTGCRPMENNQDVTSRKLTIRNHRKAVPPEVKISRVNGNPVMTINGQPRFPVFSAIPAFAMQKIAVHSRIFRHAGIELYQLYHNPYMREDGSCNFAQLDALAENTLANNPEAMFVVKVGMRDGTPAWMREKHPEDMVKFSNGKTGGHMSIASEVRRKYFTRYLQEMIKHVQASPYADRVIAYQANEGEEGQWMHYWSGDDPAQPGTLTDYSAPMERYFRSYLRKKYGTNQALQQAWNNSDVTLDTAPIPDYKMRTAGAGALRDPARHQMAIDYGFALADCITDGINYYGRIIKEATGNRALYGAMYGHLIDLGSQFLGEQVGYTCQRSVIDSPYVDYFLGPINYAQWARDYGGTGSYDMPSPQTLAVRGKLWINENDLRTHTEHTVGYAYTTQTAFASNQVMAREFLKAICSRAGFYLFALGSHMNWFDDPEMSQAISELAGIADQAVEKDNSSTADVAVFISDESVSVLRQLPSSRSNVDDLLMGYALNQRHAISRLGTPFDEYLQFDIARKDLKKYKLYIFLNPYRLHDDEFEAIRKIAQDKSSTILFIYAPGIVGSDTINLDKANKLTGMDFQLSEQRREARVKTVKALGKTPQNTWLGNSGQYFSPIPIPQQFDELLATYADGTPAIVRKGNIYFSALANLPSALLREIADRSKVEILSRNDIAAFANASYAGFHSNKTTGNFVFKAPQGKLMRQLWPQTDNAQWLHEYKWQNKFPETRIFELKNSDY
ncbi:MAG: hypothetical protein E7056_07240 [Lentisphaerae bacterium]|nr:hypothetical protein [Lentisphaerota bacterium]